MCHVLDADESATLPAERGESSPTVASRRIPKVGLFIESSRASGRALLKGVADYTRHHGPWSFCWEPGGLERAWPRLRFLGLEGIILRDVDKVDEILAMGIPAVVVGHSRAEIAGSVNVVTDSETVGRMGAEHLLACGFKHFAFCGLENTPLEHMPWSQLRKAAFEARLRQDGCACHDYSSRSDGQSWEEELHSLTAWLRSLPKPVGLMACNDDRGQQVLEACKFAGLAVPDEVGVLGVDNDDVVCGLTDPPLSSVEVNFERAGFESAEALDTLMHNRRLRTTRICVQVTQVVARRSTDVIAVKQPNLAKALQYIRDHARNEAVSVSDVARAAGLSRRALENWFRREMGHSILNEIRRVRTDHIARMLVETQLPVARIADLMGFRDAQHFARYFRAGKSQSPLAYRKTYSRRVA